MRRVARQCVIHNPLGIALAEVRARLKACKAKCIYFKKHGQRYRRQHFWDRLQVAQDRRGAELERQVLEIIHRERERSR